MRLAGQNFERRNESSIECLSLYLEWQFDRAAAVVEGDGELETLLGCEDSMHFRLS